MTSKVPTTSYKLSKHQDSITVDVTGCSGCGGNHKSWRFDLLPKKLRFRKGGMSYTHVARCLTVDRLVYLTVKP